MAISGGDGSIILTTKIDESGLKSGLSKLKSGVGAFGKAFAVAGATGVAAFAGITKAAVDSYAEFEQLKGGVETLFKDSAGQLMKYADEAYKTAGLSANDYMATVTSFSASLLQSLGGDTAAAADYADQAIIDMSDNANKMGTSMEMIQNAYQGFAKQNYTMLDNLKLGYGGTKEEMQRLLEDAEKISGIKYDISSFADVTQAIHVIQTELGITGTTALEASSTIQGSAMAMKASWQNLLTGVADSSQDFDKLIQEFVDSVITFGQNLAPRISVVIQGAVDLFKSLAPELVNAIREMLPQALGAFGEVLSGILGFVSSNIKPIVTVIYSLTTAFMTLNAISVVSTAISGVSKAITALGTTATVTSKVMAVLNVVMSTNPFGAVAAAIGLVVGGLALWAASANDAKTRSELLIEQSEASIEKAEEQAQTYRDLKAAREEEAQANLAQVAYAQSLYNELVMLADASGRVEEKDRSRAEFIIGELNSAFGTEISMVDGVIQKYGELGTSIDAIIEKKKAQILLDANEANYSDAIQTYSASLKNQQQAYITLVQAQENYKNSLNGTPGQIAIAYKALQEAKQAYESHSQTVATASQDISNYEAAMAAAVEGDYAKVQQILSNGNEAFQQAANTVSQTTEQIKQQAGQNYADAVAGIRVALDNYLANQNSTNAQALEQAVQHANEMGVQFNNVGAEMVNGQVEGYNGNKYQVDAMYAGIIADLGTLSTESKAKGNDFGAGFANGILEKVETVKTAVKSLVTKALETVGITQDSHSPAKETMYLGEFFGDGYVEGILNKEKNAANASKSLVTKSIEAMKDTLVDEVDDIDKIIEQSLEYQDQIAEKIAENEAKITKGYKSIWQKEAEMGTTTREQGTTYLNLKKFLFGEGTQLYSDVSKAMKGFEKRASTTLTEVYTAEGQLMDARATVINDGVRTLHKDLFDPVTEEAQEFAEEQIKSFKDVIEGADLLLDSEVKYIEEYGRLKNSKEEQDKEYLDNLKKTAETERKLYDARQKDIENLKKNIVDAYSEMANEALSSIEDLEKEQQNLEEKLADYGGLMVEKTKKVRGKEVAYNVLADLDEQKETLQSYYDMLQTVKERANVPQEFFNVLREMGIDEGLEYANALLELSDEDFAEYIKDWEEKQKLSQDISKALYEEEAQQLATEISDKFDEVEKEFFGVGENSADEFEDGFMEQLQTVIKNIKQTISGAFSGITPDANYGIGGYSINVPALARGSVLPGGKPFLAIVNDQPRGQTNVEAPLQTIVDAMNIALNNRGGSEIIREEHYNLNETELMTILHKLVKGGERLQGKSLISGGVY